MSLGSPNLDSSAMKNARPRDLTIFIAVMEASLLFNVILLAGMEGFEPPNVGTKNRCLTTWRHPTANQEKNIE